MRGTYVSRLRAGRLTTKWASFRSSGLRDRHGFTRQSHVRSPSPKANLSLGSRQLRAGGGAEWRNRRCYSTIHAPREVATTIYALSSAPGPAAIAVVRISGPASVKIYNALCPTSPLPRPRYAVARTLFEPHKDPSQESILDPNALVLFFPGPKSVTGEDVLELHVHGGRALVQAVLTAIPRALVDDSFNSVRYAEPGEFTRRAFLNERLDLTQVEALGDTLAALTEQQRRLSVRGTTRGPTKRYEAWRQSLLTARAKLEALIDFSDDQDLDESPAVLVSSVTADVTDLRRHIQAHRENAVRGELLRNGISLCLLGAPNVGKSSLLNRIVGREAAIVSREAGTTRDVIEVGVDIGGWYCRLGDMAGIRLPGPNRTTSAAGDASGGLFVGEVEWEGIKRARQKALDSDVVVVVTSIDQNDRTGDWTISLSPEVMNLVTHRTQQSMATVFVINKVDRLSSSGLTLPERWVQQILDDVPNFRRDRIFGVSCHLDRDSTADGADPGRIQAFLNGLTDVFQDLTRPVTPDDHGSTKKALPTEHSSMWEESLGASQRQRLLLESCLGHLDDFLSDVRPQHQGIESVADATNPDVSVAAENLRAAADCLSQITGQGQAGDVEEVLGVVFEKFCIGK